jgi:TnpA family transposase
VKAPRMIIQIRCTPGIAASVVSSTRASTQKELIINEWDNVQRIIVSLALKATTQSTIVSKLSAYARNNRTKRALWEYDNIIQSLYLLNYIDSAPLRQNVQRAVNRGENYHQLRRAVSYANFGKLRFRTEYEQLLWSECSASGSHCPLQS